MLSTSSTPLGKFHKPQLLRKVYENRFTIRLSKALPDKTRYCRQHSALSHLAQLQIQQKQVVSVQRSGGPEDSSHQKACVRCAFLRKRVRAASIMSDYAERSRGSVRHVLHVRDSRSA